ncbi:kelch-like protein 25 [Arctopsyche grandis]|uniref:kelch-like protein 25 n=1 Tax=Arctopsyche grandis TaxID=121162 RepID=UPI00406D87B5
MSEIGDEIDVQHALLMLGRIYSFYKDNVFCNVDLVVGKIRFPVHKLIIASNSDYLTDRFDESSNEIVLENCDDFLPDTVKKVVEYFYKGKLDLDPHEAMDLIKLSKIIHSQKLEDYCLSYLENALNTENFLLIGEFAKHYSYLRLIEKTNTYTIENYVDLIQGKAFLNVDADQLGELLQSHDLNVTTEEQVFLGLKLWVQKNWDNRKKHLDILFKFIRFPLLSKEFILNEVKPLCYNYVCWQQLWDLFEWHMIPKKKPCLSLPNAKNRKSTQAILIVGGDGSSEIANEIEICRGVFDKWVTFWNMNNVYNSFATVIFDEKLIILGGIHDNKPTNKVYSLDFATKELTELRLMVVERHCSAAAVVNDQVFITGGSTQQCESSLKNVERYDFNTNSWTSVAPMLEGRCGHEIAVIDDEIYVIGGSSKRNGFLNTMEIFNIKNNKWTAAPPMAYERSQFSAVALGGYIYAFGGINDSHHNSVERFDLKARTWAVVASLPEGRYGHRAVAYNEKIVCVGGTCSTVLEYDPDTNAWTIIGSVSKSRSGFNMHLVPMHLLSDK